jgi:hypothetical protein
VVFKAERRDARCVANECCQRVHGVELTCFGVVAFHQQVSQQHPRGPLVPVPEVRDESKCKDCLC